MSYAAGGRWHPRCTSAFTGGQWPSTPQRSGRHQHAWRCVRGALGGSGSPHVTDPAVSAKSFEGTPGRSRSGTRRRTRAEEDNRP